MDRAISSSHTSYSLSHFPTLTSTTRASLARHSAFATCPPSTSFQHEHGAQGATSGPRRHAQTRAQLVAGPSVSGNLLAHSTPHESWKQHATPQRRKRRNTRAPERALVTHSPKHSTRKGRQKTNRVTVCAGGESHPPPMPWKSKHTPTGD